MILMQNSDSQCYSRRNILHSDSSWELILNCCKLQHVLIIKCKSIKVIGGFVLFALDIFSNAWNSWLAEDDGYLLCFTATMEQRNWKVLNKGYNFVSLLMSVGQQCTVIYINDKKNNDNSNNIVDFLSYFVHVHHKTYNLSATRNLSCITKPLPKAYLSFFSFKWSQWFAKLKWLHS